jgi:hypothetical protein
MQDQPNKLLKGLGVKNIKSIEDYVTSRITERHVALEKAPYIENMCKNQGAIEELRKLLQVLDWLKKGAKDGVS